MKYIVSVILVVLVSSSVFAQIGIGTTTPDVSAMLQVDNTTQGVLVPRMTQAQRIAIASPATGLLVFQTDGVLGFYYYDGTVWTTFGSTVWDISGNSGTTPASNMIGTLDARDLSIVTNNTEVIRVTSNGEIGIGMNSPTAMLVVTDPNIINITQDFESEATGIVSTTPSTSPYAIDTDGCGASDNQWNIQTYDGAYNGCAPCTGNRAFIGGDDSCAHDATLVVPLGTINATSINISFDYDYDDYDTDDVFTVTLYNETTASVQATLLTLTTTQGGGFSQLVAGVPSGDDYSVRFNFVGNYDYGVTIDTVVASSGGTSPVLRIQDGNEANGYVMFSDANGNGTWTDTATIAAADDDWAFATAGTANTDPVYRIGDVTMGNNAAPFANLDIEEAAQDGDDTEIGIGSDEYFLDKLSETSISHSIVPTVHNSVSIGSATLRWSEIYATNTLISTSDRREKMNIQPLNYGLTSLLALRPVSYKWKNEVYGKTVLTDAQKRTKVGFIAQELQQVVPDIVVANEWKQKSIKEPKLYVKKEAERLGVRYAELLPVIVKATQEHQDVINKIEKKQAKIALLLQELK